MELETLQKALGEGKELRIEHAGAETIRKALVDKPENSTKFDPRGLRLTGTRITGDLDLSHAAISIPLTFEDCIFCGQIILDGAQLADVIMRRCESSVQLTAITACDATCTPRPLGLLEIRIFIPLSDEISIESTVDSSMMSMSFLT